jgi:hypothetical protein
MHLLAYLVLLAGILAAHLVTDWVVKHAFVWLDQKKYFGLADWAEGLVNHGLSLVWKLAYAAVVFWLVLLVLG